MSHSVIVCINSHPRTALLLRAGQRKARENRTSWSVLYVETPEHYKYTEEERKRLLRYITQAEQMGAEIVRQQAVDAFEGITQYVNELIANKKNPYSIIIGSVQKDSWWSEWRGALPDRITRMLGHNTEIMVLPLGGSVRSRDWAQIFQMGDVTSKEIFFAFCAVLVAFAVAELLKLTVPRALFLTDGHNVSIIFLTACAFVASRFGMVPGLVASITSFFVINFFYTLPLYKVFIANIMDVVQLALFLLAAILISLFSSYTRAHATAASARERRIQALYKINRLASRVLSRKDLLHIMHRELTELLEMEVAFYLASTIKPDELELLYPAQCKLDELSAEALQKCWKDVRTTGSASPFKSSAEWRFEPMVTQDGVQGVLGIKIPEKVRVDASFGRLLTAIADQAASILERIEMSHTLEAQRVSEEKEKLRSMLLSAVSHDLKTPLASIIGSLSVYHSMFESLPDDQKLTLTQTALDEAQRLDSFISNILDMTRLESGDVKTRSEWHDPVEVILRVHKRLRQRLRHHTVVLNKPDAPIEAEMDTLLMEQVMQNIMDNAAKYSPAGSEIYVAVGGNPKEGMRITVHDNGPGIPDDMTEKIFNKYERLNKQDSQIAGTGLGLAICKTVMDAMNGSVAVSNHAEGGAVFTITLPHMRLYSNMNKPTKAAAL